MNTVYYGNHAYGVEAAAQTYFSQHARNLTLPQSALIAGLPQAPSIYDPLHNPQAALTRRTEVLKAMLAGEDDHARPVPLGGQPAAALEPGRDLHEDPAALLLLVRDRRARERLRREHRARGRAPGLHDDRAALQAAANRAIRDTLEPARRPGGGDRLGPARNRRDPGDDRGHPWPREEPVQPRRPVGAPGGLDLQAVRARRGDREGDRPGLDLLHLGAVHVHDRARGAPATTRRASPGR